MIVPTRGLRSEYLAQCLDSIIEAGRPHICIVAPSGFELPEHLANCPDIQIEIDLGLGLPEAINQAVHSLPETIQYVGWLGDDDLLAPESLADLVSVLDKEENASLVFGACQYISERGESLFVSNWGRWAAKVLNFGPDLIPQPGSLFRRATFDAVDGLNSIYQLAFDFDLFLKLKKAGELVFVPRVVSSFRWHLDSLSVKNRRQAVHEASVVRVSHLPRSLRFISFLWEYPVRLATLFAGNQVTSKAKWVAQ